jgi:hypothetical protein
VAPSFNLEDPEVRLIDLTGDGVTDVIRSGTRFECFFNDPKKGWHETRRVERRALENFPNINFSDRRVKWRDMSGDGLQDIVVIYDGSVAFQSVRSRYGSQRITNLQGRPLRLPQYRAARCAADSRKTHASFDTRWRCRDVPSHSSILRFQRVECEFGNHSAAARARSCRACPAELLA